MRTIQVMALCGSLVLPAMAEARQTPRPLPGGPTTTPSGSYLNLTPRRMPRRAPLIQAAPGPRTTAPAGDRGPRVVCGMTLIPGDASLDPGITARATPPAGRPSIRAVDPPVCGPGPAR